MKNKNLTEKETPLIERYFSKLKLFGSIKFVLKSNELNLEISTKMMSVKEIKKVLITTFLKVVF